MREVTDIPLATNMCLVSFDQLAPGTRLRSVDIVLADVHFGNPTREKLTTPEVREPVAIATQAALDAWAQAHPGAAAELRARR